jgi:ABC-type multidrug transport system fused ATPase/permease subunit
VSRHHMILALRAVAVAVLSKRGCRRSIDGEDRSRVRRRHLRVSGRVCSAVMRASLRVLKLFHGYGWLVFWGFAAALAQIGLSVAVPRIIKQIFDRALVGGQHGLLLTYGLVLLGIGIVRFGVAIVRRLVTGKISLGIEYDLRNRLWAHLVKQPFSYYDGWPTGQLMSRAMSVPMVIEWSMTRRAPYQSSTATAALGRRVIIGM